MKCRIDQWSIVKGTCVEWCKISHYQVHHVSKHGYPTCDPIGIIDDEDDLALQLVPTNMCGMIIL